MVWAGFSAHHRTPLHHVQGNLNGQRYRDEILRPHAVPMLRRIGQGAVYQDGNARPHRAGLVDDFLARSGVVRMDWPVCSPDLNPIENFWDHLERSPGEPSTTCYTASSSGSAPARVAGHLPGIPSKIRHVSETSVCRLHGVRRWIHPLLTVFMN